MKRPLVFIRGKREALKVIHLDEGCRWRESCHQLERGKVEEKKK